MLAFAPLATAQVWVPDNLPGSGTINYAPLGAKGPAGSFQNLRTQIRVPASFFPGTGSTITDVGLAGASTGFYTYSQLEVRLAHLAGGTLVAGFAANLAGPTLVLQKAAARIDTLQDQWKALGIASPFRHDGTRDLVLDVIVQGASFVGTAAGTHRTTTLQTVYATDYFTSAPPADGDGPYLAGARLAFWLQGGALVVIGTGCPKADGKPVAISGAGTGAIGSKLTVSATDAAPSSALALALGTNASAFGSLALPLDLAFVGAPGCLLRTDVPVLLPVAATAAGTGTVELAIPNDQALRGKALLFQWLAPAPAANALQAVLSALLRATIG